METNKIILGDCIEIMKSFPKNSVSLIITDPPYGDNVAYGFGHKTIKNNENPLINCTAMVEMYRILKKNSSLYLFTNWKHYPFLTEFLIRYTPFRIRHLIVWKKHNFGLGWAFRHQYELILVLEKGKPKYNLTNFSDVQSASHINHDTQTHPHEKPIDLLEKIIKHSSKEGDLILDPFAGSGSTCKACQRLNRKWIGIELDEKYFQMARARTITQLNLNRRCKMAKNKVNTKFGKQKLELDLEDIDSEEDQEDLEE
ncbi:MAG: DNA methyltransferase [archaeon]